MQADQIKFEETYKGFKLVVFAKDEKMCHVFDTKNPNTPLTGCANVENAKKWVDRKTSANPPQAERAPSETNNQLESIESIFEKNKKIANLFEKRGKVNDVRTRLKNLHARSTSVRVGFVSDDNEDDNVWTAKFSKETIEFFLERIEEFFEEINAEIKTAERSAA